MLVRAFKKLGIYFFLALAIALCVQIQSARAYEQIDSFDTIIKLNSDASFDVTEKIQYDFGVDPRHGIVRTIPIFYRSEQGKTGISISGITAEDEAGHPYAFEKSFSGNDINIKLGDQRFTLTGKKTYVIKYHITNAINYFNDHDELYWNVTGDRWNAPILLSSAVVVFPKEFAKSDLKTTCFAGALGSRTACEYIDVATNPETSGVTSVRFAIKSQLSQGSGLTIVVGMPKGIVAEPTMLQKILHALVYNGILALPLIVLLVLVYIWYTRGRDPKGHDVIVTQFDAPDNLSPTHVGALIDERVSRRDITAAIIDLAVRGHIKIHKIEDTDKKTDYVLDKQPHPKDKLRDAFETTLMTDLFGFEATSVKLSEIKNTFYQKYVKLQNIVYRSLEENKYFVKDPHIVRITYAVAGACIAGFGFFFANYALYWTLSIALSGIFVMIFGIVMPVRTMKGVMAREHILGFKRYLTVAEKDRIEFHNAPSKNPELFEKLLPYAIVLMVEKEWARQFADIYTGKPDWYSDGSNNPFRAVLLANALDDFHSSASGAMGPAHNAASGGSGLGGGGFSGGGFGGGGGSSW